MNVTLHGFDDRHWETIRKDYRKLNENNKRDISFRVPLNLVDTILQKCAGLSICERSLDKSRSNHEEQFVSYQIRLAMADSAQLNDPVWQKETERKKSLLEERKKEIMNPY